MNEESNIEKPKKRKYQYREFTREQHRQEIFDMQERGFTVEMKSERQFEIQKGDLKFTIDPVKREIKEEGKKIKLYLWKHLAKRIEELSISGEYEMADVFYKGSRIMANVKRSEAYKKRDSMKAEEGFNAKDFRIEIIPSK